MNDDRGFVWLLVIPLVAIVALGIHQLIHHNEPSSDHAMPAVLPPDLGCQGSIMECSAAPIPELRAVATTADD